MTTQSSIPTARFKTTQEVNNFVLQLLKPAESGSQQIDLKPLLEARIECYKKIETVRNSKLFVYASSFLNGSSASIDLHDIQGFTDLINTSDHDQSSVDVLIHSPGGGPEATERIVCLLRTKFKNVNFLIPHSAYSAATMLALSGNEIILHKSATLGPIDPQINGAPAKSIKRGFDNAIEKIKQQGASTIPAYIPLLEKYSLQLLELCDDAEKLSKELVSEWLKKYMFSNKPGRKIKQIVHFFSDFDNHHAHARPITIDKISNFGLNVKYAEEPLNSLLWEAYLLISALFDIMQQQKVTKLYENTTGCSYCKTLPPRQ